MFVKVAFVHVYFERSAFLN